MKKKSLYDIAMERKNKTSEIQEQIVIERKRTIASVLVEVIEKVLKLIFYILLVILITIGSTVLINSELREQVINMITSNLWYIMEEQNVWKNIWRIKNKSYF